VRVVIDIVSVTAS